MLAIVSSSTSLACDAHGRQHMCQHHATDEDECALVAALTCCNGASAAGTAQSPPHAKVPGGRRLSGEEQRKMYERQRRPSVATPRFACPELNKTRIAALSSSLIPAASKSPPLPAAAAISAFVFRT
eukprot:7377542-Prymnesium_polylepis.1